MRRISARQMGWMTLAGAVLLSALACNRRAQPQPGVESRPAGKPPATAPGQPEEHPATRPASQPGRPATGPASAPASRPQGVLPASTFDTKPPYTVQLYVRKPEDKQPGWLKVLTLQNEDATAKARGVFPRQNQIEVETDNIRRIQVELGYLPLAERRRVVLRLDGQAVEILNRDRRFITLERRPTGRWAIEAPPKE